MSFPGGARQLLHIGAGDGAEVAAWQAAGVTRLLLAEADPDTARALARREGIEVVTGAVSGDPEPRAFRRCNLPALSSFRAPEGLAELFPGLRLLAAEETVPLDPCALAARLEDAPAALVIEAPGEGLGILQALAAGGMLDRFTAIRIQEGRDPLYAGAPSADVIRDWLNQAGFEADFEPAPEDPDRPHLFARRDPARGALADAVARGDALQAERDALQMAMEALRTELGETRAAALADAAARTDERDAARAALTGAEAARDAALAEAAERRTGIEARTDERDAARAALAEAEAARDAALAEAAEQRSGATALAAETEALRHQLAQAWQRVDERQKDLTLAQQNLAVALRMQTLREADLGELQARHGALLARVEQQDALLARLAAQVQGKGGGKDGKRRKSRDD